MKTNKQDGDGMVMKPVAGEWKAIECFLNRLLDRRRSGGEDGTMWFHSWMKRSLESLRDGEPGRWKLGHALFLVGPAGCGKSAVQRWIVMRLLGRTECAEEWLVRGDEVMPSRTFVLARHLMVEELPMLRKKEERERLMERIKDVVARQVHRVRFPRCEPENVSPFWRMSISTSKDALLESFPQLPDDFADKILVLRCAARRGACEVVSLMEQIEKELRHYLHWLLNEWDIPETLKEGKQPLGFAPHVEGSLLKKWRHEMTAGQ